MCGRLQAGVRAVTKLSALVLMLGIHSDGFRWLAGALSLCSAVAAYLVEMNSINGEEESVCIWCAWSDARSSVFGRA